MLDITVCLQDLNTLPREARSVLVPMLATSRVTNTRTPAWQLTRDPEDDDQANTETWMRLCMGEPQMIVGTFPPEALAVRPDGVDLCSPCFAGTEFVRWAIY